MGRPRPGATSRRRRGLPAGPALAVALSVALTVALTACTAPGALGPSPGSSPAVPVPSASGSVTLRVAVHGDERELAGYAALVEAYTARHPQVRVVLETAPDPAAAADRLADRLPGEAAPDLFLTDNERLPALVARGAVQPVDMLLEQRGVQFGDQYERVGLEAMSAEQALQCLPLDVSPLVVLYNEDLVPMDALAEPGEEPPTPETGWTWEQFARAVRLASGRGVKGLYVEPSLEVLLALVRSTGDDLVDDPRAATTLTFADDGARAALEEVLPVLRDSELTPTPEELARRGGPERFGQGEVAMMVATRAVVPDLREVAGLDFDVFPLPRLARDETVAGVTGMCLAAGSRHVDAAADLLAFAGGEGAAHLARTGAVVPAHVPTLNSPAFQQPGKQPESVGVFDDAASRASVVPFVPTWPDLETAVRPELEQLFYAPVVSLDTLLPSIDAESAVLLAPPAPPGGSASP